MNSTNLLLELDFNQIGFGLKIRNSDLSAYIYMMSLEEQLKDYSNNTDAVNDQMEQYG